MFATPTVLYHFTWMPFGFNGALAAFQRLMDSLLQPIWSILWPIWMMK